MGAREERYPIVLAELHFEQHSLTLELFPVYYVQIALYRDGMASGCTFGHDRCWLLKLKLHANAR